MSVRRLAEVQPEGFAFTRDNAAWAKREIAKYPKGREASAVIALLWRAQAQAGGWLPEPAIRHVAGLLGLSPIRVLEIATFYTMFNLGPVGRFHVQLCGTTPCWLAGADALKDVCRRVIGEVGSVRADGAFSWVEVECLGACCNAPMVQINDDYYEDLMAGTFEALLDDLAAGREVKTGSQTGRVSSEPAGGPTTLTEPKVLELWKSRAKPGLDPLPEPEPVQLDVPPETLAAKSQNKARPKPEERAEAEAARSPAPATAEAEPVLHASAPPEGADDLKRITGVGPKLEALLNELGIWRYEQIAAWTPENVAWVDTRLKFRGRIVRDGWIGQANALAEKGR